jgi:hypothetical protein
MADQKAVIEGLKELRSYFRSMAGIASSSQGRENHIESARTIDEAIELLKAQEPRVMTLEEVKALQPDTDIWIEVKYLNAPIRIRACTVSGFSPGGTRLFIIGGAHNYPMDMYNNYFRCWTSRPTDAQREAVKWE